MGEEVYPTHSNILDRSWQQKAPCGEELLRQRYHLSTAEAKHEAIWSDGARGGDEEELICGCSINKAKRRG